MTACGLLPGLRERRDRPNQTVIPARVKVDTTFASRNAWARAGDHGFDRRRVRPASRQQPASRHEGRRRSPVSAKDDGATAFAWPPFTKPQPT